ncbi:MAG: gephyrin-like molybdotransferase Glp [Pyrinomonadaceae bacterium]
MIAVSKAIKIVLRETKALGTETVPLERSVGRVLAEDIFADSDLPPFDRSQMDGYALKAGDAANTPVELNIIGESAAGRGWHRKLKSGEAVRIMTGAPVPDGADSIQKIELASESHGRVTIREATEVGKYIIRRGAEIKDGTRLFRAGDVIDQKMIASLAAFGYPKVQVSAKPRVSILGTGTEIVPIDKKPGQDQIRNSNSVMLKVLCEHAGAAARILSQSGDDLEKLKSRISKAVENKSDVLVMTGGVSVGKYDLTKVALLELGTEIFFEKVRLRPGKPAVFGRLGGTLIFGLPGNPVSAAVTFYLFVRTAIRKMQSASRTGLPEGTAVLTSDVRAAKERDTYFPATLATDNAGTLRATPLRWFGSSDFVGFAKADALVLVSRGEAMVSGSVARIAYL